MKEYGLDLIVTIANRSRIDAFLDIYRTHGLTFNVTANARGTASPEALKLLGLEDTEKAMLFSACEHPGVKAIIRDAILNMRIDVPGNGILATVPFSAFAGGRAYQFMIHNQIKEGENPMEKLQQERKDDFKPDYHLIVCVTNEGYSDTVMDAAREAGASGGTIIRARGTAKEQAEKFFGVSLATEKEMLFIVATKDQRDPIMKNIVKKAGFESEAKSIAFSLPVDRIAGLRQLPNMED